MPYATHMPTRKAAALAANPDLMMDLVAANRILANQGVLDSYGHVSVRSDRKPDHFYMSRSLPAARRGAREIARRVHVRPHARPWLYRRRLEHSGSSLPRRLHAGERAAAVHRADSRRAGGILERRRRPARDRNECQHDRPAVG